VRAENNRAGDLNGVEGENDNEGELDGVEGSSKTEGDFDGVEGCSKTEGDFDGVEARSKIKGDFDGVDIEEDFDGVEHFFGVLYMNSSLGGVEAIVIVTEICLSYLVISTQFTLFHKQRNRSEYIYYCFSEISNRSEYTYIYIYITLKRRQLSNLSGTHDIITVFFITRSI
jgi:hypothetical protein